MEIFNNLCRACNTKKPYLLNIFNNQHYEESTTIKKMLEYCLQAPFKNDAIYPNLICYYCVKQLEISYQFLQRFKLSQKEFEEVYTHIKGLNESPETNIIDNCEDMDVQEVERVGQEDKLGNECVFLPEYFENIKETIINIPLPIIKDKPNLSCLPVKKCSICDKTFLTDKAHNLHMKLTHRQCKNKNKRAHSESKVENMDKGKAMETKLIKSNLNVNFISDTTKNVQTLEVSNKSAELPAEQCRICNKPFFTTKALNLHLKLAHKQKITIT